jgi:aspartate racemase
METTFAGVLGGMGPLATADYLAKLAKLTPASVDQEHIPVLLYGDCTIPDRTQNIIGKGPSPLPKLLAGIEFLNRAGVKVISIPCNSAHCWYDDLAAASAVPVLHIVKASAEQVRIKRPQAKQVGVLSTYGTHQMGIYRQTLSDLGYVVITPTEEEFEQFVSPGIAMIKGNQLDEAEAVFAKAAKRLTERGAEIIVLGCTEIPVGMQKQYQLNPDQFVDSNEALAQAVVAFYSQLA